MNTNPIDTQEDEEDPIFVTDLSEFIPLLEDWHERQLSTVLHFQAIPPGQEVQIEGEEPMVLEGNTMRGFQLGIALALHYLGKLPFDSDREEESPVLH